ncbi:hypothetical protein [Sinomicrobium sp. M5D2P9]
MTSRKYIRLGKITMMISFILGTLIFGFYFLTSNDKLLFIGYGFIIIAGFFNLTVLLAILYRSKSDLPNGKKLRKTGRLMLVNIPVMFIYIWVAMILIGNMRVTFTNATQNTLTDINIVGCETEHISELRPGESKTVWIGITGDCSITLEYLELGTQKKEIVAEYVTSGMGQKMNHKIDGKNKDIL